MITYTYDARRTAEAAAWLLTRRERSMTFLKLLKLMYMADRESLRMRGAPITGDAMVSMDRGPVLSRTYDLIKPRERDQASPEPWDDYVRRPRAEGWIMEPLVSVQDGADPDEQFPSLSESDREILNRIDQQFGEMTEDELVDMVHELPEYEYPAGSSIPIDPARILAGLGKTSEQIESIAADARDRTELHQMLGQR